MPAASSVDSTTGTADSPLSARMRSERPSLTGSRTPFEALDEAQCALGVVDLVQLDVQRVALELCLQSLGRAFGHDAAAIHDRQLVRQAVRFLQVVRGEEDGHALVLRELPDLLPEPCPRLWIEARGRLVEE